MKILDLRVSKGSQAITDSKVLKEAAFLLWSHLEFHLRRCYRGNSSVLPERIGFVLIVGEGNVGSTQVSGAAAPVKKCVHQVFTESGILPNHVAEDVPAEKLTLRGIAVSSLSWVTGPFE